MELFDASRSVWYNLCPLGMRCTRMTRRLSVQLSATPNEKFVENDKLHFCTQVSSAKSGHVAGLVGLA